MPGAGQGKLVCSVLCGAEACAVGISPPRGRLTDFSPGALGHDEIKANFRQMQKTKSRAF